MGYVKRLWEDMQYNVDREILTDILIDNGFDADSALDLALEMSNGPISRAIEEAKQMTP